MLKSLLAGATALAIAGSTLVYAQQRNVQGPADAATAQHAPRDRAQFRATPEDMAAMTDARIAGLKAGLRLTSEQEKNWPAVETAIRDLAKQRADRMKERADRGADRRSRQSVDLIERLRGRADAMAQAGAGLKRLADASEPLYKSLDDGQKHRLALLSRSLGGGRWGGREHGRPN